MKKPVNTNYQVKHFDFNNKVWENEVRELWMAISKEQDCDKYKNWYQAKCSFAGVTSLEKI
jgi:hypothetical protein